MVTPSASSQEARSSTCAGAKRPLVEAGRVDHQHRRSVPAQELAPGKIDRLASAAAFSQARRLHALQPLHGGEGLGPGVARQRALQRLCRRRSAGQGSRVRIEPRGQHLERRSWRLLSAFQRLSQQEARVALPARVRRLGGHIEGEAAGHAFGDAGRLQPGVDALHAVVALDHLARDRVPLRRAPGAGRDAALAADAAAVIDEDDAVLLTLLHGPGRAGPHAPRVLAVEAGHEDEAVARQSADILRVEADDLAGRRPGPQVLVGLAVNFAGMTANAVRLVVM